MEIKDVILDIERISNLIEISNVSGRDMGQVDCVKTLEKASNFNDFLSMINTLARLRNISGDIELIQQTIKKKEFLILTDNSSQTDDIVKEIISSTTKDSALGINRTPSQRVIDVSSILPYRIIITHDLNTLRGMKFNEIYFDISSSSEKFKKIKELYPQTKIKYYGIEDFVQRKMFEEQRRDGLSFGRIIEYLKKGKKVAREGWKNDDMFIYYVPKTIYVTKTSLAKDGFSKTSKCNGYIVLKVRDNDILAWTPSADDCLANDWFVLI